MPKMDSVFSSAKSALASVPALVHLDSSAKISLKVEVLDSHVGEVFPQLVRGSWAPPACSSKKAVLNRVRLFVHRPLASHTLFVQGFSALVRLAATAVVLHLLVHQQVCPPPWLSEYCCRCSLLALFIASSSPSAITCLCCPASSFGSAH